MANGTYCNHSEDILDEFPISLEKSIKNIIKEEGYVKHKIEKKIVPLNGNFTSILYEVDISGETVDGKKITPLFIKKSITLEKITISKMSDIFCSELFIYNDFSRTCSSLQDAANVPDSERFTFLKHFNSDNDSVIMENLSKKGFKTYDKTHVIPLKFVELSIIKLAKFHALSYVIKKRMSNYFDDKIKVLKCPYTVNSDMKGFIHNIIGVTTQVMNGKARDTISNYAQRMIQTYSKYVIDNVPLNGCLCHGDYKFLNIMVKEVDGEPAEVLPIDYQLIYYGSPINDLLFIIFTSTDRDFRRKHLSYLKEVYFEHFTKFLGYFDLDVNTTYSRQEFEDDYKERLELGLVFGLFLSVFTYTHTEEGFDVRKLSLSELPIVPDEMFAAQVTGLVQDYIDWGYL